MSIDGRVTLVTGASRGIGQAIAMALGRQGSTVIGTATSEQGAQGITDAFQKQGMKGAGRVLDVTRSAAEIGAFVKALEADFGPPQILVNNAGITRDGLAMRMKQDDWDAVIDTNLSAVFRVSQACMKPMIKSRWGRIVSISSVVGASGNAGQANYAAAKAGVVGLSKTLAREVASRGVTVNVVAPGFIDTDMTRSLSDSQKEALLSQVPLQRLGLPREIAEAVAFLVSDGASYITGETLHVNGGLYMA